MSVAIAAIASSAGQKPNLGARLAVPARDPPLSELLLAKARSNASDFAPITRQQVKPVMKTGIISVVGDRSPLLRRQSRNCQLAMS